MFELPVESESISSESRVWAVAAHLLPLASLYILGALFVWLIKRDEDAYVEGHAREALNFQLSILIYGIISTILTIVLVGIVLLVIVLIFSFVSSIVAAVKAAGGEEYRYPLTIRFVKAK